MQIKRDHNLNGSQNNENSFQYLTCVKSLFYDCGYCKDRLKIFQEERYEKYSNATRDPELPHMCGKD